MEILFLDFNIRQFGNLSYDNIFQIHLYMSVTSPGILGTRDSLLRKGKKLVIIHQEVPSPHQKSKLSSAIICAFQSLIVLVDCPTSDNCTYSLATYHEKICTTGHNIHDDNFQYMLEKGNKNIVLNVFIGIIFDEKDIKHLFRRVSQSKV